MADPQTDALIQALAGASDPAQLYGSPEAKRDALVQALLAQQGRRRASGALAIMTGDPQAEKLGADQLGQAAAQDAQLNKAAEANLRFGPQKALGDQSPETYDAITRRSQVARYAVVPGFGATFDTRSGKVTPIPGMEDDDGTGMDLERRRARAKRLDEIGAAPEGWQWDPRIAKGKTTPPNIDQVKSANEVTTAAAGILDLAEPVKDFLKQHPNGLPFGKDATAIEPFVQGLQVMQRQANQMGIYRAFDQPLLERITKDPTAISSILGSAAGVSDLRTQLDAMVRETKQRAWTINQQIGRAPTQDGRWAGFSPRVGGSSSAANSKPDVRARIAQLKQSGAGAGAIRAALKSEYSADELGAAAGSK